MLADKIVTTVQSTIPDPVDGFDGYYYLPQVYRSIEGNTYCGPLVADVDVYLDEDEDHSVWVGRYHGEGYTVDELLDSVFVPARMPVDGRVADMVSELANSCQWCL